MADRREGDWEDDGPYDDEHHVVHSLGDFDAVHKESEDTSVSQESSSQGFDMMSSQDYEDGIELENVEEVRVVKAKSIAELLDVVSRGASGELHPALERRIRDFRFAQQKRREKYGSESPWGILGLYDHLAAIRIDLEWAEDAAWRRQHDEPYLSWTDFDKARDKGVNRPFFTYAMMFICTVMLIASIGVNGWHVEPASVNPMIGPSAETLVKLGAKQTSLIINQGEWFRLISPMVLHAGIIHYLLNMLALWFIGGAVETSHGILSTAIIFIIPAVGGTILSAIFLPQYISVGASGGIFGLIGACIADIAINWNLLFIKNERGEKTHHRMWAVLAWLLFDIIINVLIGLTPFVDNFTHLGGMIYGFLCGVSTMERLSLGFFGLRTGKCAKLKNMIIKFFGLILSVMFIMITTAVLAGMDDGSSPCSGCRYVSCVPFPPWGDKKWWTCDDCNFVTADALREPADSAYYTSLDLTCPDGDVETIDIQGDEISDRETIRKRLPSYCRANCDNVFA